MSDDIKLEGYCLKCKETRAIKDPKPEWASNGSPATRGTCAVCGTNVYKRGHTPLHDNLPKPETTARPGKKKGTRKTKKSTSGQRRSGKLVIVESPAKAKTIGKYLGSGYRVTSSVGHVRDLLRSRLSVDVEHDYEPEYRVPNDKRSTVKEIKDLAAKSTEVFLATDSDREGEAIAWHVLEAAEIEPERAKRVVFQEITKPAILKAFEQPRDIDMDRVDAQQARRILDRLVGYKLSPLLWRKVRGRLSAGRVQSVAVRLVVEREREINNFTPDEYWFIKAQLGREESRKQKPRPFFEAKLHRYEGKEIELKSREEVAPHVAILEKSAFNVGTVRLGTRKRNPAAPFTTSTLQQEASRKLNFRTSKTMRLAQQLYEGIDIGQEGAVGLITYMRTDSVAISTEAQAEARDYVIANYGADYVPDEPPIYKTRSKAAQEAHEAIRPTLVRRSPQALKNYLSRDQLRLYKLIWDRFVASQMAPAVYDTVSADIFAGEANVAVSKRPYMFRATGSTLRFAGFLALYEETEPTDRPDDDQSENQVPPTLTKDELLDLLKVLPEQHFTQPPPRYSEATLVKAMEEHGIGRPSTYASIVETVQKRGYVEQDSRRLHPTPTGELVNDMLVEHFPDVLSVDFTANLEDDLDRIAEGKSAWVPIIDSFYQKFDQRLKSADDAIPKQNIQAEPDYVGRD
ncbi:MAG: type I DNA topoisomerase, partial [Anaerolineales bacterium]|nr:type I DNA topoisomerase [Anaerolineales bacterium]